MKEIERLGKERLVFGAESTTEDVITGVNLNGKTALVTGASAGLGMETARVLAAAGAEVWLVGRDEAKLVKAREIIVADVPAAVLFIAVLDLADLNSVRRGAAEILSRCSCIDILINNAGIMACPEACTEQGFELQFGTNHLGHFLLTGLLLPLLKAAGNCRVVNLSSAGHKYCSIDFDDLDFKKRGYDKWLSYGQAKTANALFSVALTERFSSQGVVANAVHPGAIVTELGRHLTPEDIKSMSDATSPKPKFIYKSISQGAATSVWAATCDELEGVGGLYLEDCQIAELASDSDPAKGFMAYAVDSEQAKKLWQVSEQLVGDKFG